MKFFILIFSTCALCATAPEKTPAIEVASSPNLTIDPKARATDYIQAFDILRKEKTSGKVFFQLKNSSHIINIIEITPMSESSLLLFRSNTQQGIKLQIVPIEEIQGISYLP